MGREAAPHKYCMAAHPAPCIAVLLSLQILAEV